MSRRHVSAGDGKTGHVTGKSRNNSPVGEGERLARESRTGQFIVGREGMAKLNAIEGITLSRGSREMFAEFERNGASPEERRRAILARHANKV